MTTLNKVIESAINNAIEEFSKMIISKYEEVDIEELKCIWNNVSKNITSVSEKPSISEKVSAGCPYRFSNGKKDKQLCGTTLKNGKKFCSTHAKYEDEDIKERKIIPEIKKQFCPVKKSDKAATQQILRLHKVLNKLWHPESGLIFKSVSDKIVIGKCVKDEMKGLNKADIDECHKFGFAYDKKSVIKGEEDDKEDDDDDDDDDDKEDKEEVKDKKPVVNQKKQESIKKVEDDEEDDDEDDEDKKPVTQTKRDVYLLADSSSELGKKFWKCSIDGVSYTTRHGKLGKDVESKTKTYKTHDEAVKAMENAISEKIKKGYKIAKEISKDDIKKMPKKGSKSESSSEDELTDVDDIINKISKKNNLNSTQQFISSALGLNSSSNTSKKVQSVTVKDEEDEDEEEDEELLEDE